MDEFLDDSLVDVAPAAKDLTLERSTALRDHFPFDEVRANQDSTLDRLSAWNQSPKKFFILEGPTGYGKSPVGIAEASYGKVIPGFGLFQAGSYILTPQKTLAQQYMKDFAPNGLVELKGRSNYRCAKWTDRCGEEQDCEAGGLLNGSAVPGDDRCEGCPYRADKDHFMRVPLGTTNFSYYLNETNHAGELPNRNLLVLDEGHNTEDQILSLTDTTIDKKRCEKYGVQGKLPTFDDGDAEAVLEWLDAVFMPAAQQHDTKLSKAMRDSRDEERAKLVKQKNALENFLTRVNKFRNSEDLGEWYAWSDGQTGDLKIKPLTGRLFADEFLFSKAQKVLIMSATILDFDTFMRNLGIRRSDAETLAVDSDFPVENRPLFYSPVGDMRYADIDRTMPKMAPAIAALLDRYAKRKGIVHTNSYKINRYMVDYLRNNGYGDRIVTHDNSKGAREAALLRHLTTPDQPTVLFSPSIIEGLDLKEDLSRFQIMCKVPYPALDPYVRARMKRDPEWYQWQTALKIVQATGRSVRSRTDKAHTHILDAGFAKFIQMNNRKMPKYWLNSIVW
jgi:ATP-dependent DNA helicase DinG